MRMPSNFWTFTLGNMLTIAGGIGTFLMLWWKVAQSNQKASDSIQELSNKQRRTDDEIEEMRKLGILTTVAQHERRLIVCESAVAAIAALQTDVSWIKQALTRNHTHNE